MNRTFTSVLILSFFLAIQGGAAQVPEFHATLWQEITQLKDQTTAHLVALDKIKKHCKEDYACKTDAVSFICKKFEREVYDLKSCIFFTKYLLNTAIAINDVELMIYCHRGLDVYYGAVGDNLLSAQHHLKKEELQKTLGAQERTPYEMYIELEASLYSDYDKGAVLHALDSLYETLTEPTDSLSLVLIRYRFVNILLETNQIAKAKKIITELEKIKPTKPYDEIAYGILTNIGLSKGKIAVEDKNYDEAVKYFQQALKYSLENPDYWQVANTLTYLAKTEIKRNNPSKAENYLQEAYTITKEKNILDVAITTCQLLADNAEKEGRFETSLKYTKERNELEDQLREKKSDFDVKQFRLETERNQLLQSKKELEQAAKIKNFRTIILILGLFSLGIIAGLFAFIYYRQKRLTVILQKKNQIIEAQKNDLLVLDEAKTKFFTNVSHALRTPLTLIKGPIEKLKSKAISDDDRQLMTVMASKNVTHLENIVSEILDLTKIDAGKMTVEKEQVNLHFLLASYLSQFDSLGYTNDITYFYHLHFNESVSGEIDTFKVKRILYNLLTNAFKFTQQNGHIKVDVFFTGNSLELIVQNTGTIIHQDEIPLLFDRYFQSSNTHHTNNGTGVGLSIVKEYLDLMSGSVVVTSTQTPSQNYADTIFKVFIPISLSENIQTHSTPLVKEDTVEIVPMPIVKTMITSQRKSILLVEDNTELITYLKLILAPYYDVFSAENGQLALDFLTENPATNAIISDLMMPIMDGFTFVENIKRNPTLSNIPVIMLTARASTEDKTKALRIGIDSYLVKPFDESELLATLKKIFKNQAERSAFQVENIQSHNAPLVEEDQEWLKMFELFVIDNLNNEQLSLDFIANSMDISISTLTRQCKRLIGLTPAKYITYVRIEKAYQLLNTQTHTSIVKIAQQIGYSDLRSFNRNFKSTYGKDAESYLR